jgi:hypothetical protein
MSDLALGISMLAAGILGFGAVVVYVLRYLLGPNTGAHRLQEHALISLANAGLRQERKILSNIGPKISDFFVCSHIVA